MKKSFFLIAFSVLCLSFLHTEKVEAAILDEEMFHRGEIDSLEFTAYEPLKNKPIMLYYYVPSEGDIRNMPVLFSMHGAERSGSAQVFSWKTIAEDRKIIILAPQYEKKYYTENAYQFGGIMKSAKSSQVNPKELWTYQSIEAIFDFFKASTGSKQDKYEMYGHSAGGQFVHRFLLAMPDARANKVVAANPGSWTFPNKEGVADSEGNTYGWPYSVRDSPFDSDKSLRGFFARELVVQLGTNDTAVEGKYVPTDAATTAQGENRYERGKHFYRQAEQVAKTMGVPFHWKIVEVEGVGHAGRSMIYGVNKKYELKDITPVGAYSLIFE